jgi:predicted ATPase
MPPGAPDRLYLVTASGFAEFRDAYDGLLSMGFYNLSPEQMKEVQVPDAGQLLRRDGSNVASVIARLAEDDPQTKQRITEYLHGIVPDIVDFDRVPLGHRETLEFRQHVQGATHPRRFYAANMSDGTLRTLGVLVAAMQLANRKDRVRLVGIEEPETALHPAAAGALMDSLREAASTTQVLLTTHSPDLLDCFDQELDTLFVAQSNLGSTEIGPADAASVESLKNHLYSAGDLLRMDQLRPDPDQLTRQLELVFD